MDFSTIQAQLAELTSQLSQYAERNTMQSVPTCGVSYGQGYPTQQYSQFATNEHAWEPQQFQQDGYWQQEEEFHSRPMQPSQPHIQYAKSNSGSSTDYDRIFDEINSLVQGSQNQANEAQQDGYWQQSEEFYLTPMQPPQLPLQQFQSNSSMSMDSDQNFQLLTSLVQGQQNQNETMLNQAKDVSEFKNQLGEIMEFTAQIQEQSELSNSTIENLKEDFEIHDAITLGSAMEVGGEPKTSKPSQNMDEQLLLEE
ncbi:hypothetical protein EV2_039086 [Malus domestica]